MTIPRFTDEKNVAYDIQLFCTDCGWAIIKDRVTQYWAECRNCGGTKLKTIRTDYGQRQYLRDEQRGGSKVEEPEMVEPGRNGNVDAKGGERAVGSGVA